MGSEGTPVGDRFIASVSCTYADRETASTRFGGADGAA
jgi:hypothetical protein